MGYTHATADDERFARRNFCLRYDSKRLAIWAEWLDTSPLAPAPHREVVVTIPKRLRVLCLYCRPLLGAIAAAPARPRSAT